jgi:putative endonuclease
MSPAPPAKSSTRRALSRVAIGRASESAAAEFLETRGHRILGRNLRVGALEVDLLTADGTTCVVVEVRARKRYALVGPLASITPSKMRALVRAAMALYPRYAREHTLVGLRFDVVAVTLASGAPIEFEHFAAAFTADDCVQPTRSV